MDERRSKALPRDDDSDDSIEENFLQPKIHSVEKEVIPRKQLSPPPIEKNPPISEYCNSPKSVHETIEKETVNDKKETSPNSKNNKKTEHLLKVESSYNCDSLKDAGDSKSVTYNSNSSEIIKETKEKRVTFLVENNDCSSETSGSVDTVDEDIPTLQKVQEDSSNSDIDTPKLSNLESGKENFHMIKSWFINLLCYSYFISRLDIKIFVLYRTNRKSKSRSKRRQQGLRLLRRNRNYCCS